MLIGILATLVSIWVVLLAVLSVLEGIALWTTDGSVRAVYHGAANHVHYWWIRVGLLMLLVAVAMVGLALVNKVVIAP